MTVTRRLRTLATNPTDKGDGTELPYIALEHVESGTGTLVADYQAEDRDSSDAVPARRGDVLFDKLRPYLAKVVHVNADGCASPELLVIRPDQAAINDRYLYYLCLSKPFIDWAIATSYGVNRPRSGDWLETTRRWSGASTEEVPERAA